MWESRCKVAVSGVGFSKVARSAEIPLAAHALAAVKGAVTDSGLAMADIDGLATYPELPATGHAEVDGITIVSVNCMMAMLKLPNLTWHIQVGTTNIGGAVQQAACLACLNTKGYWLNPTVTDKDLTTSAAVFTANWLRFHPVKWVLLSLAYKRLVNGPLLGSLREAVLGQNNDKGATLLQKMLPQACSGQGRPLQQKITAIDGVAYTSTKELAGPDRLAWIVVLLIQSVPYASSLIVSLMSAFPLPAKLLGTSYRPMSRTGRQPEADLSG